VNVEVSDAVATPHELERSPLAQGGSNEPISIQRDKVWVAHEERIFLLASQPG
jgi:hypothetical protein